MKQILLIIGTVMCLIILFMAGLYFSYSNREIGLKNLASAQETANKVIADKMWKVIAQKAEIKESYKKDFEQIFVTGMQERYSKDNSIWRWIQEQNPNVDPSIYKSLMDTVEGLRAEFTMVQVKLRDIKREHDNLRTQVPGSWFVGNRLELKVIIVTSDKTEEMFVTEKENDVKLFK